MISSSQKSLLHVAKQRLGIQDEDYRALLSRIAGVSSSMELDTQGFDHVLIEFERLGFSVKRKQPGFGSRSGMATPKQIALIRQLWQEYSGDHDDKRLCAWLEKFGHVSHLRFLTNDQARNSIEGLKQMVSRRRTKTDAAPATSMQESESTAL